MQFMELSLVVGKEILSFKEQLATLLIKTRSIRLNMLIQACSQHLYRRIHRDEPEALSKMQEQLRQNPYEAKYYKLSKRELETEVERLKKLYLHLEQN